VFVVPLEPVESKRKVMAHNQTYNDHLQKSSRGLRRKLVESHTITQANIYALFWRAVRWRGELNNT